MAVTNFFDGRGGFAEATIARSRTAPSVCRGHARRGRRRVRIGLLDGLHRTGQRARCSAASGCSCWGAAAVRVSPPCSSGRRSGRGHRGRAAGEAKRELCAARARDVVVDRTVSPVPDAVAEVTGGDGVDVVYDPVGGAFAGATARCLATGGRLLAVGFASGTWVDADIGEFVQRNASIVGVYAGGQTCAEAEADHEVLLALAADGRLGGTTGWFRSTGCPRRSVPSTGRRPSGSRSSVSLRFGVMVTGETGVDGVGSRTESSRRSCRPPVRTRIGVHPAVPAQRASRRCHRQLSRASPPRPRQRFRRGHDERVSRWLCRYMAQPLQMASFVLSDTRPVGGAAAPLLPPTAGHGAELPRRLPPAPGASSRPWSGSAWPGRPAPGLRGGWRQPSRCSGTL